MRKARTRRRPASAAAQAHWQRQEVDGVPLTGLEDFRETKVEQREREEASWAWHQLLNVEPDDGRGMRGGVIARGLQDDERDQVREHARRRSEKRKERERGERVAYGGGGARL